MKENRLPAEDRADRQTVKKNAQTLNFTIWDDHEQLVHLAISSNSTVHELISIVRKKLKQYPNIIALASRSGKEVLDYLLMIPEHPLTYLKNYEQLVIILEQKIQNIKKPSVKDFVFMKCLGEGGSAAVFLVRHKQNGKIYALKQIDKNYFVEFKRMEQVLREKKIMTEVLLDFPFVSQLYCTFQSENHLNFLLEFYPGGELFFHLQHHRMTEAQARLYFCEMIITFQYLHGRKIVYRDLKPENILIDLDGHSRLSDFGLCKINLSKDDLTSSYCGSQEYMAPQIKASQGYNYSVDFYALGAFLFQMVIGVPPFYNNQPLFFPETCSKGFRLLVTGLIEEDVNYRITDFKKIRQSQFLEGIDWDKIVKKHYRMPLKINPYSSYIHKEFKSMPMTEKNQIQEQKYDKLFDFFFYLRKHPESVNDSYQLFKFIKSNKQRSEKDKNSKEKGSKVSSTNSLKKIGRENPNGKSTSSTKSDSKRVKLTPRDSPHPPCIYTFKKQTEKSKRKQQSTPPKVISFRKITAKHIKTAADLPKSSSINKHS